MEDMDLQMEDCVPIEIDDNLGPGNGEGGSGLEQGTEAQLQGDSELGTQGDEDPIQQLGGDEEMGGNQGFSAIKADDIVPDSNDAMEREEQGAGEGGDGRDLEGEMGSSTPNWGAKDLNCSIVSQSKPCPGHVSETGDPTFDAESLGPPRGAEGRFPLWIKWRGRWQAGIQCSLEDCPAATVRAMPTYGRKTYIVVYFPSTRSFVWTDWQLVCPINENPEPLAFGSHESGRSSVSDLNLARQFMLKKITAAMLDISDRLPIQAVVECARQVSFWKEFAKEAAKAVKYQELGIMLVKLKDMILSIYLKENWMSCRFEDWKHQCAVAETAGSVEKLIKELKSALCWDEIGKLWDELEQTNLDSEWKTWKEYAHRDSVGISRFQDASRRAEYSPATLSGNRTNDENDHIHGWGDERARRTLDTGDMDSEQCSKRVKSEELLGSTQVSNISSSPNMALSSSDLLHDVGTIIQNGSNTGSAFNVDGHSLPTRKTEIILGENKGQSNFVRCSAFSERKGRQCNKYPSDGSLYCCKHSPAGGTDTKTKGKSLISIMGADDANTLICSGTTKHGRRCTHKARDGSAFCLKHLLQDAADTSKGTAVGMSASKSSAIVEFSGTEGKVSTQELPISDSVQGTSNRKRKLEQIIAGRPLSFDSKSEEPSVQAKPIPRIAPRTANWTRCIGWCRGSGGQCSHRAKPGFSHCEKHLPGSLGYGGKGQEKYLLKENFVGIPKNSSGEDEKVLFRLRDLVHEYTKARLADDAARNSHRSKSWQKIIDWILSEVSGDLKASEILYDLLSTEMESLKRFLEEEGTVEMSKAIVPYTPGSADPVHSTVPNMGEKSSEHIILESSGNAISNVDLLKQISSTSNGDIRRFRCKLCAQEFVELIVLSQHWRACHRKLAQQSFRGFICPYCSNPFKSKKGLRRHWKSHHSGTPFQSNSSFVALCIICSGQFTDFEGLWQHVTYSHADQLCATLPVTEQCMVSGPASDQGHPKPEAVEGVKCFYCDQGFSTYAERYQHEQIAHRGHVQSGGASLLEDSKKTVNPAVEYKYKCKHCGLRFRLLPDLGRHHQAEHKPAQAMRLKAGKEGVLVTGLIGELNSNTAVDKEKRKPQKLDVRRATGGSQFKSETCNAQPQYHQSGARDPTIAEIECYQGPKLLGFPSNKDILAVARFVCCKCQLYNILQRKYTTLPEWLSIKAAKLCSEANVRVQFHREGYICPNGCKEFPSSSDMKPNLETSFPSASFVPLQLTAQSDIRETDYKERYQSGDIALDESHVVFTASSHIGDSGSTKTVLCEDLSFGKEMVPIPCVIDIDVMGACSCPLCVDNPMNHLEPVSPWVNFTYVTKRLLDPSLGLDTENSQLSCNCQGPRCLSENCDHVYLFDNDNTDARDIYGKPMVGRFPYDSYGCIILEEGFLVYECNSSCSCHEDCQNRVLQKGVRVKLEVYKTRHKGWAVRAAQLIARGTFVCEYIGEVLDDCEANKRGERYDKEGCSYLYDIDAHIDTRLLGRTKPFVIDATKYGNVARFINHSCSPNLVNYQVLVESMDCQLAHIGLYATRDIEAGEELAYDYRYKLLPGKGCTCHCGAKACRGRLY